MREVKPMKGAAIRALSATWSTLSAARRKLHEAGWLETRKLEARVVSVGNIQAGGAGKTPLVAWIARKAAGRGLRVCILSRGYRGGWEESGGVIRPGDATTDPDLCGDEPALLHSLVPEAWIGVGRDRARQFDEVTRLAGARPDFVILDDGFQHHRLARDLDIVAVTSSGPSEILHRDGRGALARAQLVVWTKGERRPEGAHARVKFALPRAGAGLGPVWLVSGTASPESVLESAKAAGYPVAKHLVFPDHASYAAKTIEGILQGAKAAGARVALTGKDWVKWKRLGVAAAEALVLEPELEWIEGGELCDRLLWGS
jgi:tetraacyldisaccharide 4'-kinase